MLHKLEIYAKTCFLGRIMCIIETFLFGKETKGFCRTMSCTNLSFSLAQRKELKETSTYPKAPPYMEGMQLTPGRDRPSSEFWYGSQSFRPFGVNHVFLIP